MTDPGPAPFVDTSKSGQEPDDDRLRQDSMRRPPQKPGPDELRAYVRFMLYFYALFFPAYFGTSYLLADTTRTHEMFIGAELAIPLVSWMILPYLSLFPMFLLPLVHLTADELHALTRQSNLSLVLGGISFLAIPGQLGFAPPDVANWTAPLFGFLAAVDTRYTLVPSLHVAFSALIVLAVTPRAPLPFAAIYVAWLALLAASTLLVHQHHVIDVVTGFALAVFARWAFPLSSNR